MDHTTESPEDREQGAKLDSTGLEGKRLGRYQIRRPLGAGGMGAVYEAEDETLGRTVALKILHRELSESDGQRIHREALALARLSHPNVVHLYEIGREQGRTFIAMELVRGRTLDRWQRESRSWRECVKVYLHAGQGLAAAHAVGLVHRDFKPSNCILGDDGRARVLDFGLATTAASVDDEGERRDDVEAPSSEEQSLGARLTRTGAVLGTLAYMPLEQLEGKSVSTASDQFSFCVSLYEALYGQRPFAGRTLGELTTSLTLRRIEPAPNGSRVPAKLRRALLRGLSGDPEKRWPSMDALLADLAHQIRPRARGATVLLGLGGTLGLVAGAMFFVQDEDEPCLNPEAALESTWGREDHAAVVGVFDEAGDPNAAVALPRVEAQLDGYARAWVEMYESSCRATFIDHQQSEQLFDQRMRCLERRRNRLRAAIDALMDAETPNALLERTVIPFQLPGLQGCADLEAVAAGQPPPDDPQTRERIARLRKGIDEADTRKQMGDFERGIVIAGKVVTEARELGYQPLLGEALTSLGGLQLDGASAHDAEQTLREAIMVAAEAGDAHTEAAAWTDLLFGYVMQGRSEVGMNQELAARAAVARADDAVVQSWLLNNLGALYSEQGKPVRSRELLWEALKVKEQALGSDHVDVGISWYNLGTALADYDLFDEAREAFERAKAIFVDTVGESHPLYQYARSGLCRLEQEQGRPEAAIVLCTDVLSYVQTTSQSPAWGSSLGFTLARAQWDVGQHELAHQTAKQAMRHSENPMMRERVSRWIEDPESYGREQAERIAKAEANRQASNDATEVPEPPSPDSADATAPADRAPQ